MESCQNQISPSFLKPGPTFAQSPDCRCEGVANHLPPASQVSCWYLASNWAGAAQSHWSICGASTILLLLILEMRGLAEENTAAYGFETDVPRQHRWVFPL